MENYFYYTKESIKNFKNKRQLFLMGIENKMLTEEEKIKENKVELYKDCIPYQSQFGFVGYPILEGNILRSATIVELIDIGEQTLLEGEILNREKGVIEKIEKPSHKYKWDYNLLKWTPDENLLEEGEYIENNEIISVPYDNNLGFLAKRFDKINHIWIETATEEERKEAYKNIIDIYKAEILTNGFDYNGHQQKCREKDIALLGNAVAALEDMQTFKLLQEEKTINWAFNDDDIVVMVETDLRKLRISGAEFINNVYNVESELKKAEVDLNFLIDEFINKINNISKIKCFRNKI